jgi:hypothetical protein
MRIRIRCKEREEDVEQQENQNRDQRIWFCVVKNANKEEGERRRRGTAGEIEQGQENMVLCRGECE